MMGDWMGEACSRYLRLFRLEKLKIRHMHLRETVWEVVDWMRLVRVGTSDGLL